MTVQRLSCCPLATNIVTYISRRCRSVHFHSNSCSSWSTGTVSITTATAQCIYVQSVMGQSRLLCHRLGLKLWDWSKFSPVANGGSRNVVPGLIKQFQRLINRLLDSAYSIKTLGHFRWCRSLSTVHEIWMRIYKLLICVFSELYTGVMGAWPTKYVGEHYFVCKQIKSRLTLMWPRLLILNCWQFDSIAIFIATLFHYCQWYYQYSFDCILAILFLSQRSTDTVL